METFDNGSVELFLGSERAASAPVSYSDGMFTVGLCKRERGSKSSVRLSVRAGGDRVPSSVQRSNGSIWTSSCAAEDIVSRKTPAVKQQLRAKLWDEWHKVVRTDCVCLAFLVSFPPLGPTVSLDSVPEK